MSAPLFFFPALKGRRLHLGVCGSVAAYKAVDIMRALQKADVTVSVTLTEAAARFISPLTFESLGADPVYTKMFGQDEGAQFGHLQPGRTAEAMLIAPASATTLSRLATGMADDMLAAQALAFPGPLVIAPAMNPQMWQNPATQHNVTLLTERGCTFVYPASGVVACGDTGQGRLAEPEDILLAAAKALLPQDMVGMTVLVTLGPTWESWDGVRVWTNRSTGRMGAALVYAAYLRGAAVHAVAGPGVPGLPSGVQRHDVESAAQMFEAAKALWPGIDTGIFTAAVADFHPMPHGREKFKKQSATEGFDLFFLPNADILATLAAEAGPGQRILGFAAETSELEVAARDKLRRKKTHLMAGNLVGDSADSGFAASTNRMFVCDYNGREEHWPVMSKEDVAWRLLDWLLTL
jgi:phosphopantothenoylcysteine decarboxylase/phosphopantothenate--cysteine ligase